MNSQLNKTDFKNAFKLTQIIFSTLALGQLFIFVVFIFLVESKTETESIILDEIFIYIVSLIGISTMFLSRFLYNQNLLKVSPDESIMEKLSKYRAFKIASWAMLEAAGLFSLVSFYITSNYLYVIIFILIFGFFMLNRPSVVGLVQDMQISGSDKESIFKH